MKPNAALIILVLSVNALPASFRLDLVKDSFIAGSGLALSVTSLGLQFRARSSPPAVSPRPVAAVDAWAQQPYSRTQDIAGDATTACAAASVASLVPGSDRDRLMICGVMYLESLLLSFGAENSVKSLVARRRPFTYHAGAPGGLYQDNDHLRSFPSAHTTLAFTGATFASYVFCVENPDSPWRFAVVGGSLALAAGTAVLRVSSGNHYPTDVAVAAAIGSASGIAVPMLHRDRGERRGAAARVMVAPCVSAHGGGLGFCAVF